MSLLKLFATLGLLFSNEAGASPTEKAAAVSVGVPFGCGLSFEVSQAHNTGSHLHNDVWAWDFRMPEGVPIVAAKGGLVRMARGDSTVGGCDAKFAKHANYVVIDHGDGTEAQYLHFSSVTVEAGQKVNSGELLGYSGKTGWACGSHLHFKVAKRVHNGWNNPSIPAVIEGYGDPQVKTVLFAPACTNKAPSVIHAEATETNSPVEKDPAEGTTATEDELRTRALSNQVTPAGTIVRQASGTPEAPAPQVTDVVPSGYTSGNAVR